MHQQSISNQRTNLSKHRMAWSVEMKNTNYAIRTTIGITGFVLNLTQAASIIRKKKIQSAFEVTLLSLSVADITVSLITTIYYVKFLLFINQAIDGRFIPEFIYLNGIAFYLSLTSSLLHVCFIALQRLVAVLFPFQFHRHFTRNYSFCVLGLIWLVSGSYIVLMVLKYYRVYEVLSYVVIICSVILILAYSLICKRVSKRVDFSITRITAQQNRSVILHSFCITVAFVICNLPFAVDVLNGFAVSKVFRNIAEWLLHLNVLVDPVIYFMFDRFKMKLANCCLCFARRNRVIPMPQSASDHNQRCAKRSENLELRIGPCSTAIVIQNQTATSKVSA